jgi:hypothetical protein
MRRREHHHRIPTAPPKARIISRASLAPTRAGGWMHRDQRRMHRDQRRASSRASLAPTRAGRGVDARMHSDHTRLTRDRLGRRLREGV